MAARAQQPAGIIHHMSSRWCRLLPDTYKLPQIVKITCHRVVSANMDISRSQCSAHCTGHRHSGDACVKGRGLAQEVPRMHPRAAGLGSTPQGWGLGWRSGWRTWHGRGRRRPCAATAAAPGLAGRAAAAAVPPPGAAAPAAPVVHSAVPRRHHAAQDLSLASPRRLRNIVARGVHTA